jgi:hypothetical protein
MLVGDDILVVLTIDYARTPAGQYELADFFLKMKIVNTTSSARWRAVGMNCRFPNRELFFPAPRRLGLGLHRAGYAGQDLVECLFGCHFLAAALVLAILVLAVAGAAARYQHFFPHHRNHGMISAAFASGAMIVNVVT